MSTSLIGMMLRVGHNVCTCIMGGFMVTDLASCLGLWVRTMLYVHD